MNIDIRYRSEDGDIKLSSSFENEDYSLEKTTEGERTRIVLHAKKPLVLKSAAISVPGGFDENCRFFLNGYQSWTDTREFSFKEELKDVSKLPKPLLDKFHFDAYGECRFVKYKKGELHGFTFSYVRHPDGTADFIGSLNEKNAWLVVRYKKKSREICLESCVEGRKVKDDFVLFDFVGFRGRTSEVLKRYFNLYGNCACRPLRGYTSWYLHYQDINEEKMKKALSGLTSEEYDLFQIDDGYETFVGDWTDIDKEKFPRGLADLVKEIHEKGLLAGIWLAPFVCETNSRVFREHPDWVYRIPNGKAVCAGSNWSGSHPLDIRKKEVRVYIKDCLEYFKDLGFDFFKLDFLYAAALVRSSRFTRAEMMRYAMSFLKEVLGDKLILGCGVPLSSAFGLVDYCRIGPDVSLIFDDVFYMRFMHRERISTKATLQNTIWRSCMNGSVFGCDPDVFLLRDTDISLTKEQREALTVINHLCGSLYMTSDDVAQYDDEKKKILKRARRLEGALVTDVEQRGSVIMLSFTNGEKSGRLAYDVKKGVLVY